MSLTNKGFIISLIPAFIMLFQILSTVFGQSTEVEAIVENNNLQFYREYRVMGYDDKCTYHYPRPSIEIVPSDKPFKDIWKKRLEMNMASSRWPYAFSGNVDDDPAQEIIGLNNQEFFCIDDDGSIKWKMNTPLRSTVHLVADPNEDGLLETFVEVKGTNESPVQVWVINNLGKKVREFFFKNDRDELIYDADVQVCGIIDLDHDGRLEMVCALHTAYDRYPRGIVIMDYDTEDVIGFFRCASHVTNVIFIDVNGDGSKDIVFGATASLNGAIIPRTMTNDYNSYLFAITLKGKEIWRNKISHDFLNPIYSYPMVASCDVDGDGIDEIISYLGTKKPGEDIDRGEITILEKENGQKIRTFMIPYQWIRPAGLADLDNDGSMEAVLQGDVLTDGLDHLIILDLVTGEIQRDISVPETEGEDSFIPAGLNDINGDGKLEIIVCSTITGTVFVYTSELELLWKYSTDNSGATALVSDVIPGGVNEIVCIGEVISLLTLDIELELKKVHPFEDILYLFPYEDAFFEVEVINTGEVLWNVEYVLVQEVNNVKEILFSKWAITPRPGYKERIDFSWSPNDDYYIMNISFQINITEFDRGVKLRVQSIEWKVFVFNGMLLSKLYSVEWAFPNDVVGGDTFFVQGCIECNHIKGLISEKFEFEKARKRLSTLMVIISLENSSAWKQLPIDGGDFNFIFYSPESEGAYLMKLSLSDKNSLYNYSEIKLLHVKEKEKNIILLDIVYYFILFAVTMGILGIISFVIRRISKTRLIPFIPVFSRDIDVTEHELRSEILNLIERKPGLTPKQIMVELGFSNYNTVKHHIIMLENHERIKVMKDFKKPRLNLCYPNDYRSRDVDYLSEAMKSLIEEVARNPGITRKHLKKNWPYSNGYLTRCIEDLQRRGYLNKDQNEGFLINNNNIFNNRK